MQHDLQETGVLQEYPVLQYCCFQQHMLSAPCHAGVAFSKNVSSSTDNIGYIIPYAIVEHFLSEYMARGSYQGICSPGFYTQPMENPAQQQYLKVPEGASGCVVVKLEPSTEAASHLQLADVILEIEGVPIAADETVQFREDERVEYSHLISLKHVGDNLKLKILRDGEVGLLNIC